MVSKMVVEAIVFRLRDELNSLFLFHRRRLGERRQDQHANSNRCTFLAFFDRYCLFTLDDPYWIFWWYSFHRRLRGTSGFHQGSQRKQSLATTGFGPSGALPCSHCQCPFANNFESLFDHGMSHFERYGASLTFHQACSIRCHSNVSALYIMR